MVIDTSALLAVLLQEPDSGRYETAVLESVSTIISAGTLLEASIVIDARYGPAGSAQLDRLIQTLDIVTVAVDAGQVDAARIGFRKFGKGRHVAGLNYGDCFAYALAKTADESLLFKGDDFSRTDVIDALSD